MGYIAHDTIVFIAWGAEPGAAFFEKGREIIKYLVESDPEDMDGVNRWLDLFREGPEMVVNGRKCYVFFPDGSKEGWSTSALGDKIRGALMDLADEFFLNYVDVRFGGDEGGQAVVMRHDGE